ncbi:MAG: hypothetical protein Q9222_007536 [Ikaeria aurantiellina]
MLYVKRPDDALSKLWMLTIIYTAETNSSDIIYSSDTGLWACCTNDGELDCSNPTDETFQAPSPGDLKEIVSSSSTSSTSSPASSTGSSASSSSTLPSSTAWSTAPAANTSPDSNANVATFECANGGQCPGSTGLSNGAKAGIGVGATIAGLAVLAAIFFLIRQSRRRKRSSNYEKAPVSEALNATGNATSKYELDSKQDTELDSRMRLEADGQHRYKPSPLEMG